MKRYHKVKQRVLKKLKKNRKQAKIAPPLSSTEARPDTGTCQVEWPHYVIGDIHGRMDLLTALCSQIVEDARARPGMGAARIVYLGDYVDRGDRSREVLEQLFDLSQTQPERHICLKGNHEAMMLDFLDDPEGKGARWLRNGGLQTLASFRIGGLTERASLAEIRTASVSLQKAMPKGMLAWLHELRTVYSSGDLTCVHAALDPSVAPDQSSEKTRLWGQGAFMNTPRSDGIRVAHGHTIVDHAGITDNGRLALDTGAYATGRLSAAGFQDDQMWLLTT